MWKHPGQRQPQPRRSCDLELKHLPSLPLVLVLAHTRFGLQLGGNEQGSCELRCSYCRPVTSRVNQNSARRASSQQNRKHAYNTQGSEAKQEACHPATGSLAHPAPSAGGVSIDELATSWGALLRDALQRHLALLLQYACTDYGKTRGAGGGDDNTTAKSQRDGGQWRRRNGCPSRTVCTSVQGFLLAASARMSSETGRVAADMLSCCGNVLAFLATLASGCSSHLPTQPEIVSVMSQRAARAQKTW